MIRNFPVVRHGEDENVGRLADFKRARFARTPGGRGGVERGRVDGFGGAHVQVTARERHHHLHVARGAEKGVVPRGESNSGTALDHTPGGREAVQAEVIGETGKQNGDGGRVAEMVDLMVSDVVAVRDAFSAQGDGKFNVGVGLVQPGVEARTESGEARGAKKLHGLVQGETAGGWIGVDVGNGFALGDAGEHFVRKETEIAIGVVGEFERKGAGTEPSGDHADGAVLKVFQDANAFHLAGVIKAVSGFSFDGRRAVTDAVEKGVAGLQFESTGGEAAHVSNLGVQAIVEDAALFKRCAQGAHFKFVDPRRAADQVCMGINKAGHDDAAIGLDDMSIF